MSEANGTSAEPDDELDGEAQDLDDPSQWVAAADLARLMGLPVKAITEMGERGHLTRIRENAHRPWMYRIPELKLRNGSSAGDAALATMQRALKQSDLHARESFRMVHEPSFKLFELLQKHAEHLMGRCTTLEASHTEMVRAREAALSEVHVRELATQEAERRGARLDGLFSTLAQTVPPVAAQVFETWAEWKKPKAGAALELVRELAASLLDLELTEEQREKLRAILVADEADAEMRARARASAEKEGE